MAQLQKTGFGLAKLSEAELSAITSFDPFSMESDTGMHCLGCSSEVFRALAALCARLAHTSYLKRIVQCTSKQLPELFDSLLMPHGLGRPRWYYGGLRSWEFILYLWGTIQLEDQ